MSPLFASAHGLCVEECPEVFELPSGTATFRGHAYVSPTGEHHGHIASYEFVRLAAYVLDEKLVELHDRYDTLGNGCANGDHLVVIHGRRKTIQDYGESGPAKLWSAEQVRDKLLLEAKWADNSRIEMHAGSTLFPNKPAAPK